mgnify:CR=1 FL=1
MFKTMLIQFKCISIHSLRVEGDFAVVEIDYSPAIISIHSLRVEGDLFAANFAVNVLYFNPLPPCGGRQLLEYGQITDILFQSTPSVWRETVFSTRVCVPSYNFNPLPPCGGRPR